MLYSKVPESHPCRASLGLSEECPLAEGPSEWREFRGTIRVIATLAFMSAVGSIFQDVSHGVSTSGKLMEPALRWDWRQVFE